MTTSTLNLERLAIAQDARAWFPDLVADAAAAFFVTPADVLGNSRHAEVSAARHVTAWVLREADLSLPSIGRLMGRDHTTILNSVQRVEANPTLLALAWGLADRYARTPRKTP